ncbi:MAG: hypothetical protein CVU00_12720 [Bacteroidetes bacterium HGW-Bacteroidetes-17]|nr:MAG: hypothetical protein CVU00_12720 [Bacteroidetes bacterium HGW-Bacteroidetes-17]
MKHFSISIIVFFFLCHLSLQSQNVNEPLRPAFTKHAPIIDGSLDDQVWTVAPQVSNFKTFVPDFGKDMSEKTVVYMAYDKNNLYFAYRCYDREPEKIKATITNRDNISTDDWICINLDTYNDHQSLTAFYVNPYGIQMDSRFSNNVEDASSDFIWYSAGKIDSAGYTIEIQIPLKSIRFNSGKTVEMALFFERKINRRSEQGSYPALNPDMGQSILTQLNPIVFENITNQSFLEILPAITYNQQYSHHEGKLNKDLADGAASLTLKYGITSNLILDATYHPDFSQIESDAGQIDVNLRSNLFFAEKRPFFLEGSETYNFGAIRSSSVDPVYSVIHTRTIVNPEFGVKLAGKIGNKNDVSFMYAKDELNNSVDNTKFVNVPIFRYKRSFGNDSYLGGVYTSRESEGAFNRLSGIDGSARIDKSTTLVYHALYSNTKREDANQALDGHAIGLRLARMTRDWRLVFTYKDISENFIADMGHITRTGLEIYTAYAAPQFYPKTEVIRKIMPELFIGQVRDKYYNMWETFNFASVNISFGGQTEFIAKYYLTTEIYGGERFKTNGFHTLLQTQLSKQLAVGFVSRWNNAIYYSNPQQGKTYRLTGGITYQPSEKITADYSLSYANFKSDLDHALLYDYSIHRLKLTYQLNKYLLFRGITEYNSYRKELLTDFLASFTYIPGTVIHLGYGSVYDKLEWDHVNSRYDESERFIEFRRGFFFKVSYLWRI